MTTTMRLRPRGFGAAAIAASMLLAACGTSTPTRYHTIESSAPADRAPLAHRGPALQVRELRIPAAMDRQELVNERIGGEVQLREFDHWAAPLDRSARQALTQDLAARLPPGTVAFAGAALPAERLEVNVDVLSMRISGTNAEMWVAWSAQRRGAAASPPQPARELRLRVPASDDAVGTARAWSALLGQLADRIAAEVSAAP